MESSTAKLTLLIECMSPDTASGSTSEVLLYIMSVILHLTKPQCSKLKKGETFQVSPDQLNGHQAGGSIETELCVPSHVHSKMCCALKNHKGFRMKPEMIEGHGFFSNAFKHVAKAAVKHVAKEVVHHGLNMARNSAKVYLDNPLASAVIDTATHHAHAHVDGMGINDQKFSLNEISDYLRNDLPKLWGGKVRRGGSLNDEKFSLNDVSNYLRNDLPRLFGGRIRKGKGINDERFSLNDVSNYVRNDLPRLFGCGLNDQKVSLNEISQYLREDLPRLFGQGINDQQFSINDVKNWGQDTFGRGLNDQQFSINDVKNWGQDTFGRGLNDQQFSINDVKNWGQDTFGRGLKKGSPQMRAKMAALRSRRNLKGGDINWDPLGVGQKINDSNQQIKNGFQDKIINGFTNDIINPAQAGWNHTGETITQFLTSPKNQAQALSLSKQLASFLLHKGLPATTKMLGAALMDALAVGSIQPELLPVASAIGAMGGEAAGNYLADYIGSQTGYGFNKLKSHRVRGGHGTLVGGTPVMVRGGSFRSSGGSFTGGSIQSKQMDNDLTSFKQQGGFKLNAPR